MHAARAHPPPAASRAPPLAPRARRRDTKGRRTASGGRVVRLLRRRPNGTSAGPSRSTNPPTGRSTRSTPRIPMVRELGREPRRETCCDLRLVTHAPGGHGGAHVTKGVMSETTIAELLAARGARRAHRSAVRGPVVDVGRGRARVRGARRVCCETLRRRRARSTSACCSTTCPSTCSCSAAPRSRARPSSASTRPGAATELAPTSVTPTARSSSPKPRTSRVARRPRPRRARATASFTIESDAWHGARRRARATPSFRRCCPAPDDAVRADLHVGIDGRAQGGARHAGPVRALRRARCRSRPTTSCTARCRCSTATRSRRTSCPR